MIKVNGDPVFFRLIFWTSGFLVSFDLISAAFCFYFNVWLFLCWQCISALYSARFRPGDFSFVWQSRASRTCPYQSYRNPVEGIMSVLNLGLQYIGLMHEKMSDKFEKLSFEFVKWPKKDRRRKYYEYKGGEHVWLQCLVQGHRFWTGLIWWWGEFWQVLLAIR